MKQFLLILLASLMIVPAMAQRQRNSPHDTLTAGNITVTYGRPYKKGRVIFGTLEPYGKVWRVGADEATTITFAADGLLNGLQVKAGTYTLFAVPNEKEWTIILNSQLKQWGAYGYEKAKDKNVLETKVVPVKTASVTEQLTIRFANGNMYIEWDDTSVPIPVK